MKTTSSSIEFTALCLSTVLFCMFPDATAQAAQIKNKDGTLIEGHIRGTLVLRDLRHVEEGGGGWGLLYYVVPGNDITLIDERGVHWNGGKEIEMYIYVLGMDPKDDLRGLSREFMTSWNFTLEHKGGNSSSSKGPPGVNPIPMSVYGEVRYDKDNAKVLSEIEVETGKGVTKVPISSISAVVAKPKVETPAKTGS